MAQVSAQHAIMLNNIDKPGEKLRMIQTIIIQQLA